jgi:protein-disulfide isomerase
MARIIIVGLVASFLVSLGAGGLESHAQSKASTERELPKALVDELKVIKKDLEALKDGQKALTRELIELKKLLTEDETSEPAKPKEVKEVVVSVDNDPFKGERTAKVTLIEFSDYQCPFCARFSRETLPKIEEEYIATGKLTYVFRDFPIVSIHKDAFKAAEAANCAGDQKKYWEMHDRLFANQKSLKPEDLPKHAEALGLDRAAFETCLKSEKHFKEVQADLRDGLKAGVKSTPTFFLGLTQKNNKITAATIVEGAQPYAAFKEAIDALLEEAQK